MSYKIKIIVYQIKSLFKGTASLGRFSPHFLEKQQNIFSKRFQFITIKFFFFFRTNKKKNLSKNRQNISERGSFARKEEIERHLHTLRLT